MPRALVTGASRGIGKASALALADAGFDVAVAARTLREGDGVEDDQPIEGSVEATCALVASRGRRALPLVIDLLDLGSLSAAAAAVESEWGGVDVLVNNAVHTGEGSMTHVVDLTPELLRLKFEANVVAQVVLSQLVLPRMLSRGSGTIINITSAVAISDPAVPAGAGGWGFAYAMSKGAFHRLAGLLAVELGPRGIQAFNVEPGFVMTERMERNARGHGFEGRYRGAPPSVPASVVAWLATAPEAAELNGQVVHAQKFALDHGLHPDWR